MDTNFVSDDVRNLFRRLGKYWKIYPVVVLLFVAVAWLYVNLKPKVYELGAKLVVHEVQRGVADPSTFVAGSELFAGRENFANSLLTIQALPIIHEALSKIDTRIEYFQSSFMFEKELYKSSPFNVVMDAGNPQLVGVPFQLEILSDKLYRITIDKGKGGVYDFVSNSFINKVEDLSFSEKGLFGEPFSTDHFKFTIFLEDEGDLESIVGNKYSFIIKTDDQLAEAFKSQLVLEPANLTGTVLNVSIHTGNVNKGMDFLKAFLETVIANNLERKNHIAVSTIDYIDRLLANVSDSLQRAERTLQQYQTNREVLDVNITAERLNQDITRINEQRRELVTKVEFLTYLSDQIKNDDDYTEYSMSAVMSLNNNSLSVLMEEYVGLVGQRSKLIENKQTKNPLLVQIERRISNLRRTIRENVRYSLNVAQMNLDKIETQRTNIEQQIRRLPETQRNLINYKRDFRLNDETYTYLMEKKAEAQIARISNLPDYEVFDPPAYIDVLSPKRNRIIAFAIFLGLLLPTILVLFYDAAFGKISSEKDIGFIGNVQYVGEVLHTRSFNNLMEDRQLSHDAEAFRKLRSHVLAFSKKTMTQDLSKKIILLTSSVQGEGKSFTSYFLARSLGKLGRPTLLIELDLRRPRLVNNYMPGLKGKPGLINYINNEAELGNIIYPEGNPNFYIIPSGGVPPNPSEILEAARFREMLTELKEKFDFIILDSAPLIVTDTRAILPQADVVLMLARSGYTPNSVFRSTLENIKEFRTGTIGVILNDVSLGLNRRYYNYRYGYK